MTFGRKCSLFINIILCWHELHSSCSMHVKFNPLSDYAESLKLITFVVFLFWVIENYKSVLMTATFPLTTKNTNIEYCGPDDRM